MKKGLFISFSLICTHAMTCILKANEQQDYILVLNSINFSETWVNEMYLSIEKAFLGERTTNRIRRIDGAYYQNTRF